MAQGGWLGALTRAMAGAAAAVICVMMMVTVADVVLRSLFAYPIFGTFDVVELSLVTLIFLALPETFRREEHVVVDIVDHVAPARVVAVLRAVAALFVAMFLGFVLYNILAPAYDTYLFHDVTLDLGIPRYIHWLPIILGTAAAILVSVALLLRTVAALRDAWRRP